ncbi:MAG: hypothetical protein Q9166_007113 [cf. Caloplaca sp. 2 TL-2023]
MAHMRQYTKCEMEAAVALIELSSPSASFFGINFPHIDTSTVMTAAPVKKQRKSVIRPRLEEDLFLIEGRRAGMTVSQLKASPNLPTFRDAPVHQISSQLRKLQRAGHDVTPQTDDARKRSARRKDMEQTKEMNDIAEACRQGMTPKEILAAGIVRHGKIEEKCLKQRIYRMGLRGVDVTPR